MNPQSAFAFVSVKDVSEIFHFADVCDLRFLKIDFQETFLPNNLLNYEDFKQHIADIDNSIIISELSSEISHQELIQKHCSSYRTCREIVEHAKTTPDPQKYKAIHQSEYKLHDTLKQQLLALGITKLPSPERLQKKIDNLRNERSSATKEK